MTDTHVISDERVRAWLESAEADADRRGLPDLKPVLRLFAQATATLRAADWNGLTPPDDE
ncbi:MAG TPA: hypothetical protein VH702_20605 [Vicinamibacterales bacterium]|jgi:hypothetical protein